MREAHPRMAWIYWIRREDVFIDVVGARALRHSVAAGKP
ncbi:hypothetical protein STLA111740_07905 [Stenotrophomonas lactitubi]|jgi:hypothetical protein